ncbi:MAG TPA: Kae1-associated kinase Bud32 [Methanocella sp.]|uniref:Kae1-associated kinase Bud32 n=1 Tax=Methanocella sp. TaxID=2052833 RepID=UPI002D085679|nr:Kae1-associated kinase Bud32 [Methanocella sp.]HTY92236.1 Kae1-associated kinase Bud32 [Methanocella sp.]
MAVEKRGAEAVVLIEDDETVKTRIKKGYRIRELDERLRSERTRAEAKIMSEARKLGIPTPIIYDVGRFDLVMETIHGTPLKDVIDEEKARKAGVLVGKLHSGGIIHGDLTTSNMLVKGERIYLIDFGLSFWDEMLESRGVDVHVFYQTLISSHTNHEKLMEAFAEGYRATFEGADDVLERVREIEYRGRYKTETP